MPQEPYEPGEDRAGSESITAGASRNSGTEKMVLDIRVPARKLLVVTDLYNYAATAGAFGTPGLMFSVIVDGSPHPDYFRLRDQIGSQSFPRRIKRGKIQARTRLQLVFENDSGTDWTAGAGAMGDYIDK